MTLQNKFIGFVTVILILVLTYAAVLKGLNIQYFGSQMSQSPLLPTSFIPFLSYFVPAIELFAAILLTINKTRYWGLLITYGIMLTFSGYLIMLVIFYKHDIPCACGGILGQMGYTTHIIFNIALTILAVASIFLWPRKIEY